MESLKKDLHQDAEELLAMEARELLDEELNSVNGGCFCHNTSSCMSFT